MYTSYSQIKSLCYLTVLLVQPVRSLERIMDDSLWDFKFSYYFYQNLFQCFGRRWKVGQNRKNSSLFKTEEEKWKQNYRKLTSDQRQL